jgi:PAS domain S-box-containing protein
MPATPLTGQGADPTQRQELNRVQALHQLVVLDTAPEPVFDAITATAGQVCETPIALLTLVDVSRQWFKSNCGLHGVRQTPRDLAFCDYTIRDTRVFEVADARLDTRFSANPLVTGYPYIRFYAGAPIVLPGGACVGTVCVIDRRSRVLTASQRATLQGLATIAGEALVDRGRHVSVTQELEASESKLEALAGEQGEPVLAVPHDSLRTGPTKILIVDDEPAVALGLKLELETLGYTVVGIAETAAAAVAVAQQWRPHLALVDITLEPDGVSAAEALRAETDTPVVVLAAMGENDSVAETARNAAYGYVTKPLHLKALRAGIEIALWKAHMERQLRESDRWFALTLRCVQDGVVVIDSQARIRFMNLAAEALTGCSNEEAGGRPVGQVVRFEDDGGDNQTLGLRALDEGRVVGFRYARQLLRREGGPATIDESAGPIQDEQGRRIGAVLVLRDAGPRLQQQARLRASEERFRKAFEAAPLGMALVSLNGQFLQVNEALCQLLDCTPAWLLGHSQADVGLAEDSAHEQASLIELQTDRQAVTQFEKRYSRASGGPAVRVLVNASLLTEGEEPTCYLYQVHDLTAQQAAARQLAELAAERIKREASESINRSQSQFLTRIGHEMRTPLNAVLGFAELLKLQQADGSAIGKEAAVAFPDHILTAGKHLLALVEDVMDLQRATDGTLRLQPTRVALEQALPAAMQLLMPIAAARGVRVQQSVEAGLAVWVDETRLNQIMLNLGTNAIKYNVQGGTLVLAARRVATGRAQITVTDTGIGMSGEQLAHLFEPFNRLGREALRIPGVGLGLVITRQLVTQMGGTIVVACGPGGGTVVTLEFAEAPP